MEFLLSNFKHCESITPVIQQTFGRFYLIQISHKFIKPFFKTEYLLRHFFISNQENYIYFFSMALLEKFTYLSQFPISSAFLKYFLKQNLREFHQFKTCPSAIRLDFGNIWAFEFIFELLTRKFESRCKNVCYQVFFRNGQFWNYSTNTISVFTEKCIGIILPLYFIREGEG